MIEKNIDIETRAGAMNTFVVHPDWDEAPAIIFYMDAPGKREELHGMARRLAEAGYYVILPNMYYRKTREFVLENGSEGLSKMFDMASHLHGGLVMEDTSAILNFLQIDRAANHKKIGALGYCMSGPHAFRALAVFNDQISCAASIYGANLVTESAHSPHLLAHKIVGEMYFACAEYDDYAPRSVIDDLDEYLKVSGVNYNIEFYPGAHHGFAFRDRGAGIYDEVSAEKHWERLFSLFSRNLLQDG